MRAALIGLAACTAADPSPAPDDGGGPAEPTYELVVNRGYGGGTYPAGARVHVFAAVDPATEVVAGWSGDAALLDTPAEWNAELVMPARDVALDAELVASPFAPVRHTYPTTRGDREVWVAAPSGAPRGSVLFFHGAAYSIDQLGDAAPRTVAAHLLRAGFVVVALPSMAEVANGTGGWSAALTNNADLDVTRELVDQMVSDGVLPDGAPQVAWGMSSGGMFAHTVGAALPADVVLASCAPGTPEALASTAAATGWYLAERDQTFPTAAADSSAFAAALEARGIRTDRYVHATTPVYDERFLRVPGVDSAGSASLAAALRATPSVTDEGVFSAPGSQAAAQLALDGLDPETAAAVVAEVEILGADHELYDDAAARMTAFVVASLDAR